jgi:hypothetical protein
MNDITPEMIEAGLNVLQESGRLKGLGLSSDRLLAEQVFLAMRAASHALPVRVPNQATQKLMQIAEESEEPIVTYSDDWQYKSDAERRRWALEQVGVTMRTGDLDNVEHAIRMAQKVVDYVTDGPSASQPAQHSPDAQSSLATEGRSALAPLGSA